MLHDMRRLSLLILLSQCVLPSCSFLLNFKSHATHLRRVQDSLSQRNLLFRTTTVVRARQSVISAQLGEFEKNAGRNGSDLELLTCGWTNQDVQYEIDLLSIIKTELRTAKRTFDPERIEPWLEKSAKQITVVAQGELAIASAEDKDAR
eukprot:3191005-Rhodomonas_salina.1